jgi:pyrroloquinoline quinone biosynthesis protein D
VTSAGSDPGAPQRRSAFDQQLPLQLGKQFRLQWEPSQGCHVLLYPEGMVQLQGGAEEIMKRIDGKLSLLQLISVLEAAFPGADLRDDVVEFAEIAHAKGWLITRAGADL